MTPERNPIDLYRGIKAAIEEQYDPGLEGALYALAKKPEVRTYFSTIALAIPRLLPPEEEIAEAVRQGLIAPRQEILAIQNDLIQRYPDMRLALEFIEQYGEIIDKPLVEVKFLKNRIEVDRKPLNIRTGRKHRSLQEKVDAKKRLISFLAENQGRIFGDKEVWRGVYGEDTPYDPLTFRDIRLFLQRVKTRDGRPLFVQQRGAYGILDFRVKIVEDNKN